MLLYNFNELVVGTSDEVPNLGHAGNGYDLLLGALPKPAGSELLGRCARASMHEPDSCLSACLSLSLVAVPDGLRSSSAGVAGVAGVHA